MASSRWKRFAFFERNTLSLPSEVLEDIIPRSSNQTSRSNSKAVNDSVSLVVTTAALPMNSKPKKLTLAGTNADDSALTGMWSSLAACAPIEVLEESGAIRLPSQAQIFQDDSNVPPTGAAMDGLVLAFITSADTEYLHCFDVTVRCNPPDSAEKDLEDMDGWRGYIAPFKGQKKPSRGGNAPQSAEDRIIADYMEADKTEGIIGIATCRATTGHRPLHMACIAKKNVIVCVDPQLYLSW